MGTSHPETKPWVIEKILASGATRVLDVGAGAGNWYDALRAAGFEGRIDAVEVWAPYVRKYRLLYKYETVFLSDVRELAAAAFEDYDVVIFGDVMEHMTKDEAVAVWDAAKSATHAAIAIPIIHYCQGPLDGNPHEVHVKEDWSVDEVVASFDDISEYQAFSVTGAFWR